MSDLNFFHQPGTLTITAENLRFSNANVLSLITGEDRLHFSIHLPVNIACSCKQLQVILLALAIKMVALFLSLMGLLTHVI